MLLSDVDYRNTFFLTYRSFATADQILEQLIRKYPFIPF